MSDATVSSEGWVFDTIPHYRLNIEIIDGFLLEKWPGYEFYTEVSPRSSTYVTTLTSESTWERLTSSGSHENSKM